MRNFRDEFEEGDGDGDEPESLEARILQMERKIERLRSLYESYFLGAERAPPSIPRREMNRKILEQQQFQIVNASLRFRFQSVVQRWVLYTSYWNRTMREIEAGTYARDIARAQRHLAQKGGGLISEQEALAMGIPVKRVKAFVERQNMMTKARARRAGQPVPEDLPAAPAATAATAEATAGTVAPSGVPSSSSSSTLASVSSVEMPAMGGGARAPMPGGVSDEDVQRAYQRYVEERGKLADTRPVPPLETVRERLRTQIAKIMDERKDTRRVTLDVGVEGGKVRFKARPIKE